MTFRAFSLLAVCFASSIGALNAPLADAARSPSSGWVEASAQQSVTIEDVQRILAPDKGKLGKGKSDTAVARQLSGLELTERMSSAKLKSLEHLPRKKCLDRDGRDGIDPQNRPVPQIRSNAGDYPVK